MEQDLTDRRTIVPDVSSASPAGHGYAVDGRVLVSVTKVIGTVLRAPQLEEWMKRMGSQADVIRDEAAAFGKSVDAALGRLLAEEQCSILRWSWRSLMAIEALIDRYRRTAQEMKKAARQSGLQTPTQVTQ